MDAPGGVRTYREYTDDFVKSRNQDKGLPEGYVWLHKNILYRIAAAILYVIVHVFTFFYSRFMHVRIENRKVIKECRDSGYFLYGNHTQPMGDAFFPTIVGLPRRVYTIMGTANMGIPFLGKILPILGGLAIPDTIEGMKEFIRAIRAHTDQKKGIVVFPEAHVWPWCNFIRPYPDTAFQYPVMLKLPSYCMTTTYQKRKHGDKPRITIYVDGPFYPDMDLRRKEAQKKLHDEIYDCMQRRNEKSTYAYIKYVREPNV